MISIDDFPNTNYCIFCKKKNCICDKEADFEFKEKIRKEWERLEKGDQLPVFIKFMSKRYNKNIDSYRCWIEAKRYIESIKKLLYL